MLYLLEIFTRQNIPAELNLICSFNNDGYEQHIQYHI
jgi:hypothetical protein